MATTANLGLKKQSASDYVSVDPLNSNWDTLDKLGKVYATGFYTSGNWVVCTWSNGYKELWGRYKTMASADTEIHFTNVTFPVTFSSAPYCTASAGVDGTKDSYVKYCRTDTSAADVYVERKDGTGSSAACQLDLHVFGK